MSHRADLASNDVLDLLVSAAARFGLLLSETTAAFTGPEVPGVVGTPTEACRLLLEENLAALRWRTSRGRLPVEVEQLHHVHRPVARFEPVEVIKTAHAYQRLAADSHGWAGSAAHHLVDAIVLAATRRLPGYAETDWAWTRPPPRDGAPVGLRRSWIPVERGVTWLTPTALGQRWDDAALVVLAVDALADIPDRLAPRPGVYLCALGGVHDTQWPAITRLRPDVLVLLPAGRDWLLAQLADPSAAVQRADLPTAASSVG